MVAALISAAVAFLVLALTQWAIYRRERTALLLGKLEELYSLLLTVGDRNGERSERIFRAIGAPQVIQDVPLAAVRPLEFDDLHMADLIEKIEMFVEFYFPQLRSDFDALIEANQFCIGLIGRRGGPPDYAESRAILTDFAERAATMRRRIMNGRLQLIRTAIGDFANMVRRATYG